LNINPIKKRHESFEVFMAEKIKFEVFWVVMPRGAPVGYQRFE
jgi:hypothetical protein